MNIDLIAKMKSFEDFLENYNEEDNQKMYQGKSLLFYAMSNNDVDSRYKIVSFLLDKGTSATCINEENETLLHILFSRVKHNIEQTIELADRLLTMGVDVNQLDKKHRSAMQYVISMKYTDEELAPLYEVLFTKAKIDTTSKNDWGFSLLDLATKLPYRNILVKKLQSQ